MHIVFGMYLTWIHVVNVSPTHEGLVTYDQDGTFHLSTPLIPVEEKGDGAFRPLWWLAAAIAYVYVLVMLPENFQAVLDFGQLILNSQTSKPKKTSVGVFKRSLQPWR